MQIIITPPMELLKDYLLEQLINIKPGAEELKSLSIYLSMFSEKDSLILECIEYIYNKSGLHHRLTLYYLVHEVIYVMKSGSGVVLKAKLKEFVRKNFLGDKKKSVNMPLEKKYQTLYNMWVRSNTINFDDGYNLDEVVRNVYKYFNDKKRLVAYLTEICDHYNKKK